MKTVLTVDDSPTIRRMVSMTLGEVGYKVVEAVDGLDGLEKATSVHIDAVITDQNMPNMDGLTFIGALRRHPAGRGLPIIVLSTESDDSMKAKARQVGATGWMVKPFDQAKLIAVVRKVIG